MDTSVRDWISHSNIYEKTYTEIGYRYSLVCDEDCIKAEQVSQTLGMCVLPLSLLCFWNYSLDFSAMMDGHRELHTNINPVSPRLLSVREFYHGNRDETRTEQEKDEQQ